MRRGLFIAAALIGGLVFSVLVLELALRFGEPVQHVQIVRPGHKDMRQLNGTPVWRSQGSEPRENRDCTPQADGRRWLMLGSSIFYGSGLSPEESPGAQLQAALGEGHCVHNFAQPAFTFASQAAVGDEALEALAPSQVLWEIWDNSPLEFVVVDGTAYNLHGFVTGPDGLPQLGGAPPAINRWMMPRSRIWETLALRSAARDYPKMSELWRHFTRQHLEPALRRLLEQGVTPTLYLATPLDRPFAEQRAEPRERYTPVEALAQQMGVRVLRGELLLGDAPVEEIRLDPCCHVNARGAQLLAEALSIELTENPPSETPEAESPAE